ncbi:MAG: hypothetical protein K2P99_01820 [Burkholderiales bacterium]|nr:hypothetical protein [Burkholderiales bacterium]
MDEFINEPKPRGFSSKKILLVGGILLLLGVGTLLFVLRQSPLDSNSQPITTNGVGNVKVNSDSVDTNLSRVINGTSLPEHGGTSTVAVTESPPIVSTQQQVPGINNTLPANDQTNTQIIQLKQQEKLKRIQQQYAAYSSKTSFKVEASGGISSERNSGLQSDLGNKKPESSEHDNIASDDNNISSKSSIQIARSPYELNAGSLIPSVMISGLNSEITGTIIAQVRENVYDTATGRFLLIPQGSRLLGTYNNGLQYGAERIAVGWNRIIYPNGNSVDLKGVPGSDLAGYAGFADQVNNHYWKLFGASFIMGVITGAMQYSQNNTSATTQIGGTYNPTVGQTMSGALGQQLGQTGLAITNKGLNISPTIIIRQGYTFNILLTADLILSSIKN